MNVKCFVSMCNNPVIGQCSGYKDSCGRFYCSTHSIGTLCADCAKRKAEDDRLRAEEEALRAKQAAEEAALQAIFEDYLQTAKQLFGKRRSIAIILTVVLFLLGCWMLSGKNELGIIPFILWFIMAIGLNIEMQSQVKKIDNEKPGFKDFFKAWRKEKAKAENTAFFGALLGAAGVAAAAYTQYQRQRTIDDIHEIRKRLDDL